MIVVSPSLVPSASASSTRGDAPLSVAFTGGSTGGRAPYSYTWTFGDGLVSASQNPTHVYTGAGTYTATFSVLDANLVRVSAAGLTIIVQPQLAAADSGLPNAGEAPLPVAFTSNPAGGTAPYSYAWTFGDGGTSTSASPSHTYTAVGVYTARLTVTDAVGVTAAAPSLTIVVNTPPSTTAAASPTAGDAPVAVSFTSTVSSGTAPFSYAWTFGDGGSSTSQSPSHTYTAAGTYHPSLTITDAAGRTASATTAAITVSPALTATSAASATSGTAPMAINFTGSPAGGLPPYTYAWSFGDGSAGSSLQNPTHTYATAGTFSVVLTVTDANGARVSATPIAIVLDGPLGAMARAVPAAGDAPLTTSFTGSAAGGRAPYTYSWDFGDGTTSPLQSPNHIYNSAGTFAAALTIHDASGQTATATASVVVSPSLGATSSAAPTGGNAPLTVAFTGSATGGKAPFTFAWTFGDGSSSALQDPGHVYGSAGNFNAILNVTDANGVKASATQLAIVVHGPLGASSTAVPSAGDAPFATTLTATASGGTAPFSYAWTFGDGATSSGQNISHTYTVAGAYSARVTITDATGATATAPALAITVNPPPAATASAGSTAGDAPMTVTLAGSASGGTGPYRYAWAFGDGATSSSQNPSHTYSGAGTYSAILSIIDADGHAASASAITITVSPMLSAGASVSPLSGSSPLAVTLTGTPSGGAAPYTYAWTFGDGSNSTLQNPSHAYAAGSYVAQLMITDANGAHAIASTPSISSIGPLAASATASKATGDAPLATTLDASVTGGTTPYSYAWNLGDGSASTSKSSAHSYSSAGTYTATITVTDAHGQVAHGSTTVTVYPAMGVSVSATPISGLALLQATFNGSATGGLAPYSFTWSYGDGANGSGAGVTHSYGAGTFHPMVTVHDAAGGTWSGSAGTISVSSASVAAPSTAAGGGSQPRAAAPSPPSTSTSPSSEPSASPSSGATTPPTSSNQSPPSGAGGTNSDPVALMLLGSLFATGLGGWLFLNWLRHRG